MHNLHRILVFALAMGLAMRLNAETDGDEPLALGAEAPTTAVQMKGTDGEMYTLADVRGEKGTLVIFSCNSCPWAIKWERRVASIGNAYQTKGFGVIVINANDPARVSEDGFDEMVARAQSLSYEFPYVADPTSRVARAFGARRTPEVFLFHADGKLVYHGAIDDNASDANAVEAAYLKDALDALLAGKAIAIPETKALGCSIKFNRDS